MHDNLSYFDNRMVDGILGLMVYDLEFFRQYGEKLIPTMFHDEVRMIIAQCLHDFFKDHHSVPGNLITDSIISYCSEKRFSPARARLIIDKSRTIAGCDNKLKIYIEKRLNDFFQFSYLRKTRLELDKAIDSDNLAQAKRVIQSATKYLSTNGHNSVVDYFRSTQNRIERRFSFQSNHGINFMVPTLDRYGVFAHRGEITLGIAPSKRGKSIFMTHVGKCAIFAGYHVLHVSLENPISMVEDRYDSMLSGLSMDELEHLSDILETRIGAVNHLAKGRLYLLWRAARSYSPLDLSNDIERLRASGKAIDAVIVDYGEIMKPIGSYSGNSAMRAVRDDIFANLRGVATALNIFCITAQQTPLKKRNKFRLGMEDGQEASMPAQHSSLIITLNQTPDEAKIGEMRLFVDGYWHGPSGYQIGDVLLEQDFSRMQFCVKEKDIDDGVEAQKRSVI